MSSRRVARPGAYDRQPTIPLPDGEVMWSRDEVWSQLGRAADASATYVVLIDTYPGAELQELMDAAARHLPDFDILNVEDAALPIDRIDALIGHDLTDDRVFGILSHVALPEFYDPAALEELEARAHGGHRPTVVIGWGAALIARPGDVVVLADLARWEIQQRLRAGAGNWRCSNGSEDILRKYKRGFFVEWRVADRHKRDLFDRTDFVLDANRGVPDVTMIAGDAFRSTLRSTIATPFRVVPFFDPGVWGGQWMKQAFDLDASAANYAWCFDCVPEENSLLIEAAGGELLEIPAMDLVLRQPRELLGAKTFARFGAEFPIRFDFLDTMGGGNLSLQVHPLTDYIQDRFGMHYTQDESYYMLDAGEDAVVYLGLKDDVDPAAMMAALTAAQSGEEPFVATEFVNRFPAKKHDHFSIPAGTVHCSGANSMVLEISATPFIFTFKLWDWGRLGLDGVPRPVHLEHGGNNIQWDRDTAWVRENLLDQVEVLSSSADVVEERTGLHSLEFIEVRRHWFDARADHDTRGTVNVLNLVEGDQVEVFSPDGSFAPLLINYAETFIVPADVGRYSIRPSAESTSARFGTVKAYVRGTSTDDE
jgi:mannose-6-phosphate isomerase class I